LGRKRNAKLTWKLVRKHEEPVKGDERIRLVDCYLEGSQIGDDSARTSDEERMNQRGGKAYKRRQKGNGDRE